MVVNDFLLSIRLDNRCEGGKRCNLELVIIWNWERGLVF